MRRLVSLLAALIFLAGCYTGTAPQELEQLRARAATLEAENAHVRGQLSLAESERDQLKDQSTRWLRNLPGPRLSRAWMW